MDLAKVEGDELVIRLPVGAVITATSGCDRLSTYSEMHNRYREVKVTDPAAWMAEVARELNREAEDGTTLVHIMFDTAFDRAADQGAEGIWIEGSDD
jgi:hypothetical protein